MSMPMPERTVAELFSDLSQQLSTLFRQEALLARTEVTQRVQAFARDAVVIGIGAALGLAALMAATAAIVLLLIQLNLTRWIAAVLTAALLANQPAAESELNELARARAEGVRSALLGSGAIDPKRVFVLGTRPVASSTRATAPPVRLLRIGDDAPSMIGASTSLVIAVRS